MALVIDRRLSDLETKRQYTPGNGSNFNSMIDIHHFDPSGVQFTQEEVQHSKQNSFKRKRGNPSSVAYFHSCNVDGVPPAKTPAEWVPRDSPPA